MARMYRRHCDMCGVPYVGEGKRFCTKACYLTGLRSWLGLGCMCEIRDASYVTLPNWSQGFAVTTWSDDRSEFGVEPVEISEGRAFFRGQMFTSVDGRLGV